MNPMFTHSPIHTHIRPSTTSRLLLAPLLACALLVGLALGPVETAQAQTDIHPPLPKVEAGPPSAGTDALVITSAPWRAYFGEHAAEVLRGTDPKAKRAALRDLIAVARNSENTLDLSETVTPLVGIFEEGRSEDLSLMALQALHVIGPEHSSERRYREAMSKVYQIAQEKSSEEVRRAAASVLKTFNDEQ
jgi:hypothetical protein